MQLVVVVIMIIIRLMDKSLFQKVKLGSHGTLLHLPLNERMSKTRTKQEDKIKEGHLFTNNSDSGEFKLKLNKFNI